MREKFYFLPHSTKFDETRQDKTRQLYLTRVAQSAARLVSLGALRFKNLKSWVTLVPEARYPNEWEHIIQINENSAV